MADILQIDMFKTEAANRAETCRRIYKEMKFDPSNVSHFDAASEALGNMRFWRTFGALDGSE